MPRYLSSHLNRFLPATLLILMNKAWTNLKIQNLLLVVITLITSETKYRLYTTDMEYFLTKRIMYPWYKIKLY